MAAQLTVHVGGRQPDPVDVIKRAQEAGLGYPAIDARLRQFFPKMSPAEMAAAYREVARQIEAEADALERYLLERR